MQRKRVIAAGALATLAIAVGTAGLLLAKGDAASPALRADDKGATVEGTQVVADGMNAAAFGLYSKLAAKPGNVFFSPYSVGAALAMTGEGARGRTAEEIRAVFGLPADDAARRSGYAALHNALNPADAPYQLSVANALWPQRDYRLEPDFVAAVRDYYAGAATPVDFKADTEGARQTINHWVEQRTQDRIKNLFEPGSLDEQVRLVLTNAIYFKGTWQHQFDPGSTQEADFTPEGKTPLRVPLMHINKEEAKYGYAEVDGTQALELPYAGGSLSMLVLLPQAGGLAALEGKLDAEAVKQWRQQLQSKRVEVYLPRFKLNTKYELNAPLAALGMPAAFNPDLADFSGMEPRKELYIDLVIHQAFVEVNEEGTEAAAATGVAMRTASAMMPQPVPVFRADHSFVYLILEKQRGTVLFMGRLERPE